MRKFSMVTAALLSSTFGLASPSIADGEYLASDEPIELDVFFHTKQFVYNDEWPVEKAAAAATNVSLKNFMAHTTDKTQDAFNVMLAAGDLPDIVGGQKLKESFNQYGLEGAFIPLNDLIDEHAPHLKAYFDEHPDVKSAISASDGNVYFIPYLPDGKYARAYFMRTDWLKKLGLEVPQNVDELYNVLTAFRNDDPNGNGQKDEIPVFSRDWEEMLRLVTMWDGHTSGADSHHDFYVNGDQIGHGYLEDSFKEGIKNLSKWYAEGLIDPEIFTRGGRSREQLLSADQGGFTHDWFASTSGYNSSLADKVDGFEFKAIVPPENISGKRIAENRRSPIKPDGWAISYTNEHPVETIKYFDYYFTEEGRRLANFGIEGVHYDMIDGKAIFKPEILDADEPLNNQLKAVGAQVPRGFYQDYGYEIQWSNEIALEGIALYDQGDYLQEQYLGVAYTVDEKKVYDDKWPSAMTYMEEMIQAWILGARDVEADWDEYKATLEKMGAYEVLELTNAAYQRQYKSN